MPYSNDTKPSSSYINDSKGAGSYTNDAIGGGSYTFDQGTPRTTYLLMEDGYRLLQEDGSPIVLTYGASYVYDSVGVGSYSNDTKS